MEKGDKFIHIRMTGLVNTFKTDLKQGSHSGGQIWSRGRNLEDKFETKLEQGGQIWSRLTTWEEFRRGVENFENWCNLISTTVLQHVQWIILVLQL